MERTHDSNRAIVSDTLAATTLVFLREYRQLLLENPKYHSRLIKEVDAVIGEIATIQELQIEAQTQLGKAEVMERKAKLAIALNYAKRHIDKIVELTQYGD